MKMLWICVLSLLFYGYSYASDDCARIQNAPIILGQANQKGTKLLGFRDLIFDGKKQNWAGVFDFYAFYQNANGERYIFINTHQGKRDLYLLSFVKEASSSEIQTKGISKEHRVGVDNYRNHFYDGVYDENFEEVFYLDPNPLSCEDLVLVMKVKIATDSEVAKWQN